MVDTRVDRVIVRPSTETDTALNPLVISVRANENLGAGIAVTAEGIAVNPADSDSINKYVGITKIAIDQGVVGDVLHKGVHRLSANKDWDSNEPVVIGSGGSLVQEVPANGHARRVGFALDSNQLLLETGPTIKRLIGE